MIIYLEIFAVAFLWRGSTSSDVGLTSEEHLTSDSTKAEQSSSLDGGNRNSTSLGWNWEMWWTYDGISGPEFWGVYNPAWIMCSEGRRQSPINLDPRTLLHDPNLTPLSLDKTKVSGELANTGHSLEWKATRAPNPPANLSGGPLSYIYTLSHLSLHFGERDLQGSEHTIANYAFPAELQIYGYNSQLYKNFSQAVNQVYGIVAIGVLVQLGDKTSSSLTAMLENLNKVKYGGLSVPTADLVLSDFIPSTDQYMTYEGSLTEPGCQETVTWILPNKPLYIAFSLMRSLRGLRQGSSTHHRNAPLGNNFRPIQSAHHRTVRTNIDFTASGQSKKCSMADSKFQYKANSRLRS